MGTVVAALLGILSGVLAGLAARRRLTLAIVVLACIVLAASVFGLVVLRP